MYFLNDSIVYGSILLWRNILLLLVFVVLNKMK